VIWIWLYTLRYHRVSFDRFFWLWSFPHAVFPETIYGSFPASRSWSPYELPDLWPPNSPDLISLIDYKIWRIIQQQVCQTKKCTIWTIWCSMWLICGL